MTFDYESWLNQANDRLEQLYVQRESIDQEIAALQKGIEGFSPLVKKYPNWIGEAAGITESVKQVLRTQPNSLFSPTQIRDELLNRGVKLAQRNPMASIHQILARLIERKVVKTHPMDGRTLYQWWIGNTEQDSVATSSNAPKVKKSHPLSKRYGEK